MNKTILKKILCSKTLKRTLSALVAFVLFFGALPITEIGERLSEMVFIGPSVSAEDEEHFEIDDPKYGNGNVTLALDELSDFSSYARKYHKYHQNDVITIDASSSTSSTTQINVTGFSSLGTESYPFNGQIKIKSGLDITLTLDAPLFDYVYDSVTLNDGSVLKISRWYPSGTGAEDKATPLLANNIVHKKDSTSITTWKVKVTKPANADTENTKLHEFGGFIGRMWKDYSGQAASSPPCNGSAKIKVEANIADTNGTTDIVMNSTTDHGMLCGTMDAATDLDFKLTVASGIKISSIVTSSGSVGGLAGVINSGAKLNYNGPDNTQYVANTSDSEAKGSNNYKGGIVTEDGYAGGIVGKNNGGTVTIASTTGDSALPYPIKQTIIGTTGAGGVYGYYKPASDVTEIKTDIYNVDCILEGKGSNGGLFGVLDSTHNISITVESHSGNSNTTIVSNHLKGAGTDGEYGGIIGLYKVDSKAHSLSIKGKSATATVTTKNAGGSEFYGGGIGRIDKTYTSYVKFEDFTVNNASNAANLTFGGLVASADNSFIDAKNITIVVYNNFKGGGLVGSLEKGVLRMDGAIDLSGAKPDAPGSKEELKVGQIVGYRDDALVYAKSTWTFTRAVPDSNNKLEVDDIGGWGEVIRLSSDKLTGLLTEDDNNHKVTVNKPSSTETSSYTSIESVLDFAKTALCMQIKANDFIEFEQFSDNAEEAVTWETLKTNDINIKADIDLSGTGITGLTRDNDVGSNEKKFEYKGTIQTASGVSDKTITLAVGETYGTVNSGVTEGNGKIYRHNYNGLIGYADGATVKNLKIDGSIKVNAKIEMFVGAVAACAKGNFTATTVQVTTNFSYAGSSAALKLGGMLGKASFGIGNISITGTAGTNTVKCVINGSDANDGTYIGGVIGLIDYTDQSAKSWSFTNVTVTGSIKNTWSSDHSKMGGLIAYISACSSDCDWDASVDTQNRSLSLSNVKVNSLSIEAKKSGKTELKSLGGLLGYSWLTVNVDFNNVEVKDSSLKLDNIKSGYGDMAGLVYEGTGHWTVNDANDVKIDNITVTASGGKSFGMFVNKAWNGEPSSTGSTALFLELKNTSAFTIAKTTNNALPTLPSFEVFDDIAAYSAYYNDDGEGNRYHYYYSKDENNIIDSDPDNPYILQNGAAIISIKTGIDKGLNMDGSSASKSYTPQTKNAEAMNVNTRYYYNLDRLSGTSAADNSDAANLMKWGLRQYAHKSIKNCFKNGTGFTDSNIPNKTYDMRDTSNHGYSWYPVDIDGSVTVNGTFKLYNKQFEESESKEDGAHVTRSSLSLTQHYLLHNGLFRNVNSSSTVNIGTVTLQGNVGRFRSYESASEFGSGALICGRVQGAQDKNAVISVTGSIELDRVYVHDIGTTTNGTTTFVDYAPLAINKVGDYSKLSIKAKTLVTEESEYDPEEDDYVNVKKGYKDMVISDFPGLTSDGGCPKAGTSLIGKVGISDEPVGIILDFSKMVLDGRTADIVSTSSTRNEEYTNAYGTTRSIFTKATLLDQFKYDSGSFGKYNFGYTEDHQKTNGYYLHEITYGKELGYRSTNSGSTSEYPDKELWYSGEDHTTGRYTNPGNRNDTTGTYSQHFIDGFLPYVAAGYNKNSKLHQIMVNQTSADFSGCGTYNDPYIINTGEQLGSVSKVLNDPYKDGFKISIPNKKEDNVIKPNTSATWHDANGDTSYHYMASYTSPEETNPETGEVIKESVTYPAGYYKDGIYVAVADENTDSDDYLTPKTIQTYLAGAYFKIGNVEKITIGTGDGFTGLGYNGAAPESNKHAIFRGVFIGDNKTIENNSGYPFIATSNGCVVKDLTLNVNSSEDISITGKAEAFKNDSSGAGAYGGLIAKVLGGDNIIDNVLVDYSGFEHRISLSSTPQLAPVGGYIGVVANGGVIFRNMSVRAQNYNNTANSLRNIQVTASGYPSGISSKTVNKMLDDDNLAWLYVNPVIGRVINGYAVTESSTYRPFEDGTRKYGDGTTLYWNSNGTVTTKTKAELNAMSEAEKTALKNAAVGVTLKNGTKHYSITDISTSADKLDTFYKSTNNKIGVPNGQALFVMSLMVNSGIRSNVLGYTTTATNYHIKRWASYTGVKTDTTATTAPTTGDYSVAKDDNVSRAGYLANAYTTNSSKKDKISGTVVLTSTNGAYYLPDGFKGIGNMYNSDSNYHMSVTNFDGNGATISMNSSCYYYYSKYNDNAISPTNKTVVDYQNIAFDYSDYLFRDEIGFGLFNNQHGTTNADSSKYYNFTLTGNVTCDCIDNKSGNSIPYLCNIPDNKYQHYTDDTDKSGIDRKKMVSVGMLMGTSNAEQYIDSVAVVNIDVKGVKTAGGLIGLIPASKTTYLNSLGTASERIIVHSGGSAGGMIGKSYNGRIDIDNNNATYSITEVVSDCDFRSGGDFNYGVGGFIGFCRNNNKLNDKIDSRNKLDVNAYVRIQNVVVGQKNASKATKVECNKDCVNGLITGGLIGMQNKATLILDNCKVYNQSVKTPYISGGLLGYIASTSDKTAVHPTLGINCNKSIISNTEVYSNNSSEAIIESTGSATKNNNTTYHVASGGFIGAIKYEMGDVIIRNSTIEGYDIKAKEIAGGAVGIVGQIPPGNATDSSICLDVQNFKAFNCDIMATNTDSNSLSYSGGIVGALYEPSGKSKSKLLNGYNILAKDLTFSGINQGTICGWRNEDTYCLIKLAGFSRQDDRTGGNNKMITDLVGSYPTKPNDNTTPTSDNLYGTGGYVVFADYKDAASSASNNKLFSELNKDYNVQTMRSEKSVTVNTKIQSSDGNTTVSDKTEPEKLIYGDYDSIVAGRPDKKNTVVTVVETYYNDGWKKKTTITTNDGTPSESVDGLETAPSGLETTQKKIVTTTEITKNQNYPYVTSSPRQDIDTTNYLTGDAMGANSYVGSTFKKIMDDADPSVNSAKAYAAAKTLKNNPTELDYIYKHFLSSSSEFIGGLQDGVKEFPLIVVEDTDPIKITGLINNYIRVLTNTSYNYAATNNTVYKVDISRMQYSQGKFVQYSDDNVCLKIEDGTFKTAANKFDTGSVNQFTLVDVQFMDPSETAKVAYHLYIPVYVKKILTYNFYATLASNTEYHKTAYPLINKNPSFAKDIQSFKPLTLFENLGNSVTLAFEYEYARTTDEWISLLNGGEDVYHNNNFYKSIMIKRHSGTWPEITKLVLVDSTKNGKNYYLDSLPEPQTGSTLQLNLKSFKDSSDTEYKPSPLNDLMQIETESDNVNGTLVKIPNDSSATEKDKATFRDKNGDLFKLKTNETTELYKVKSVEVDAERYYLSIFTKKPKENDTDYNSIFYYEINTKDKFEQTADGSGNDEIESDLWRPNKKSTVNSTVYLLMGNLYSNSFTLTSSSRTTNPLMTKDNNYISVKMTSTVKLTPNATVGDNKPLSDVFKGKETDSSIYQAFLMTYDIKEKVGNELKNTLGIDPNAASIQSEKIYIAKGEKAPNYFDNYNPGDQNETRDITVLSEKTNTNNGYEFIKTNNYIEIRNNQNMVSYFADDVNSNAVTIQVSFDLLYDENGLAKQFPQKGRDSTEDIGSAVIGYSNISSKEDGLAYSSTSEKQPASSSNYTRYYTEGLSSSATMEYNMKENTNIPAADRAKVLANGQYRDLGINAKTDAQGKILSRAKYDTNVLSNRNNYQYVELSLVLSEKTNYVTPSKDDPTNGGTALKIDEYLTGLKIYGKSNGTSQEVLFEQGGTGSDPTGVTSTISDDGKIYTIRVSKDLIETQGDVQDGRFIFDFEYTVLTGDGNNKWNKKYSNYKVSVSAKLCNITNDGNNTPVYNDESWAADHIIYTNAKIDPNVI